MNLPTLETLRAHGVWASVEAVYAALEAEPLTADNLNDWLRRWSEAIRLVEEINSELYMAITTNTADEDAAARFKQFSSYDEPKYKAATTRLNQKLLDSGLQPDDFGLQLRKLAGQVRIYRAENAPLLTQQEHLTLEYNQLVGAQTVQWRGEEWTISRLNPLLQDPDRAVREEVWRLGAERRLQDRATLNDLWAHLVEVRHKMAENSDLPDYRAFRWYEEGRYDYTPDDCKQFAAAIKAVIVPAVSRLNEKRRVRLGLDRLRPWDMAVEIPLTPHATTESPLKPFTTGAELAEKMRQIFNRMDPKLGEYFTVLHEGGRLDLENRKHKAPGGYCIWSELATPFIFMNAAGTHNDVVTLAHESGHSFHNFETRGLRYHQQLRPGREFTETASTTMELLTMPYWEGTYYDKRDATRAQLQYFNSTLPFFPFMATVDLFQHWVYENPVMAKDGANCDAVWADLRARFMPDVDWSGLEEHSRTQWQHTPRHIFLSPLYYVEYALSQLGALQIWQHSLTDEAGAIAGYRRALAYGGTRPLAELFQIAHGRFAFDAETLRGTVEMVEQKIGQLEAML